MQLRNALGMVLAIVLLDATSTRAVAQIAPVPDPEAVEEPGKAAPSDWDLTVGAALAVSPNFLGSKDTSLKAAPIIEVHYKDRFFLSPLGGAGVNLLKAGNFRAGPLLALDVGRRESGKSLFQIAGKRDVSLVGLGQVKASPAAGGFAEYRLEHFAANVRITQSFAGDKGLIANMGAQYSTPIAVVTSSNKPPIFTIGPKATLVDKKYNNAYFGVDDNQSIRSGLDRYTAKGGLQSYGVGSTLLVPLTEHLSATIVASYDRLSGDAADSPLVSQRGSADQASAFLAINYHFGH